MPARHHRTVDRTVAIIEQTARSRDGVTLAELAKTLSAPKSSVQELTFPSSILSSVIQQWLPRLLPYQEPPPVSCQ